MVNARQLAEQVALSLGRSQTATLQHAKNLREAKGSESGSPLVSAKGRGRNAPTMTQHDAATLICAVLGSEAVQDSVKTVEAMRKLKPQFQGRRTVGRSVGRDNLQELPDIGIRPQHDVTDALGRLLLAFGEQRIFMSADQADEPDAVYADLVVEYPQHYASLTVGVRDRIYESWTYGQRKDRRDKRSTGCDQRALQEIASALISHT